MSSDGVLGQMLWLCLRPFLPLFVESLLDDICLPNSGIERPTFTNLNRCLAQILSSLMAALRTGSPLCSSLALLFTRP